MKKESFLISMLFICYSLFGSIYTPNFSNLTIQDGLSNSTVRCKMEFRSC